MNIKKVLITGGRGMLGSVFLSKMASTNSICQFSKEIDITDVKRVSTELESLQPDIIVHSAAYTDVDGCELDPNKAQQVNVFATQNIVNYCKKHKKKFIFISSTGIYGDHKQTAFCEDDQTIPTTVHHRTKLEAETIVKNTLNDFLIIRVGWLYGGNLQQKNNFVFKRFLEARQNPVIYSSNSQKGNPTNCEDVVNQVMLLIKHNVCGIYNCVNTAEDVTRFDYVKEIVDLSGLACKVNIAPLGMYKRIAAVSCNESAINANLNALGMNIMPFWKDSVRSYILKMSKVINTNITSGGVD